MPSASLIALIVVLCVVVPSGGFYIYRQRRLLETILMPVFRILIARKTGSARPWSWQFLINETDLESAPEVEGEDDRDSLHGPPMTVGDSSLPIIPPLAFDDAQLVPQLEDPLALPPQRASPVDLPAQPSTALLTKSNARRGSDTVTLADGTLGVGGVAYPHDAGGVETIRSSIASSIIPPSYHSCYPDPGNPQNDPVTLWYQWPTTGEGKRMGEGVEEDGARRPSRSVDGGVRLAGGRPGEGDSAASDAEELSEMPPTYHDYEDLP